MMWEPLMVGKFGERYANQVNMAWMWARIKARTTRLGTYVGGFQAFADDLANYLQQKGVKICLSTPVSKVTPHPTGGLSVEVKDQVCTLTNAWQLFRQVSWLS
jgi:phytoene dehydrogenase-like protein